MSTFKITDLSSLSSRDLVEMNFQISKELLRRKDNALSDSDKGCGGVSAVSAIAADDVATAAVATGGADADADGDAGRPKIINVRFPKHNRGAALKNLRVWCKENHVSIWSPDSACYANITPHDVDQFNPLMTLLQEKAASIDFDIVIAEKINSRKPPPSTKHRGGAAAGDAFHRKARPVPDDIQANVKTLLANGPISGAKFQSAYRHLTDSKLDYNSLGYRNLTHMLTSIPDVKSTPYSGDGPGPNSFSLE